MSICYPLAELPCPPILYVSLSFVDFLSQRTVNHLQYALPRLIAAALFLLTAAHVLDVAYFLRGNDTWSDSVTYGLGMSSNFVWDVHAWFGIAAILYIVYVPTRSAVLTLMEGAAAAEKSIDLARTVMLGIWIVEVLTSIAVNVLTITLNVSWVRGILSALIASVFIVALGVAWTALLQLRTYMEEKSAATSVDPSSQASKMDGFITFIRILTVACLFLIGWNIWIAFALLSSVASSPPILPREGNSNAGAVSYVSLATGLYGLYYTWKGAPDGNIALVERQGSIVQSARSTSLVRTGSIARVAPLGAPNAAAEAEHDAPKTALATAAPDSAIAISADSNRLTAVSPGQDLS